MYIFRIAGTVYEGQPRHVEEDAHRPIQEARDVLLQLIGEVDQEVRESTHVLFGQDHRHVEGLGPRASRGSMCPE